MRFVGLLVADVDQLALAVPGAAVGQGRWSRRTGRGCAAGIGFVMLEPPLESWVFIPLPPMRAFSRGYIHAVDVLREPFPPE